MVELWKDVVGFEALYEVSNLGRVRRSMRCPNDSWRNRISTYPGRICKQRQNDDGYMTVGLTRAGRMLRQRVHVLVAAAFIGPTPADCEVNHIDTDKTNNRVVNLEYLTHLANMEHARAAGLWDPYGIADKGVDHWNAALTEEDVREVRRLRGVETQKVLAQRFRVCVMTICRIQKRQAWKHVE